MDLRSEAQLALLCPALAAKIRIASDLLNADGTHILVVSGLRTAAQQNALYAQGRTAPGHVVTNAKAGQSLHNYGLAADIVPYLSGANGPLNWNADTPQFKAMVGALKLQGLTWGGDFKSIKDFDHIQLGGYPDIPSQKMQAEYHAGGSLDLSRFWPAPLNT